MPETKVTSRQLNMEKYKAENLVSNGNFINQSENGYGGGNPVDWSGVGGRVAGGTPPITKQQLLDTLDIVDGDLEGLWLLNEQSGSALDLSSNSYDLTDNATVLYSTAGMMGDARDFVAASSEYFSIANASCPNLEISGNQTWFCMFKPDDVAGGISLMSKHDGTNLRHLSITSDGKIRFQDSGLSATLDAKPLLETGKWNLVIAGVTGDNQLFMFVNGIWNSSGTTGTTASTTGDFNIGSYNAGTGWFYDGLMQCAGVLSTDVDIDQCKRLWSLLSYSGAKVMRGGTDSYYRTGANLGESLGGGGIVERYRGKTLTLSVKAYKDTAGSEVIAALNDGTTVHYTSAVSAADGWEELTVTMTVADDAERLSVHLWCNDVDGNAWFKEVMVAESDTPQEYVPSQDDWARFPNLLRMKIPRMYGGFPYQYEEKKWYDYNAEYPEGFSSDPANNAMIYSWDGENCHISLNTGQGTSNAATFHVTLPIFTSALISNFHAIPVCVNDSGTWQTVAGVMGIPSNNYFARIGKDISTVSGNAYNGFTTSGGKSALIAVTYPCQLR